MQKIPFEDRPATTTPVDADNLNLLQNNVENDLGILTNLTTTSKTNLVSAINETKSNTDNLLVDEYSTSNSVGYTANFLNELIAEKVEDTYSTDEVKTNKYWIDGKPIYRKVISINAISTLNTDVWTSTGITPASVSDIWIAGGYYKFSNGSIPLNFYNSALTSYANLTYLNNQTTNIRVCTRTQFALLGGNVIIEYTKAS